ncbi:APH-domain-containing protein [Thozetella sp. PMI_491]|nr:APH-domain-containing protein [Thozetella sp. PMI_491]
MTPKSPDPTAYAQKAGLKDVTRLSSGLNFTVFQATSPSYGQVALRIPTPESDILTNINDGVLSVSALLTQDLAIFKYLSGTGIPVPVPHEMLEVDGRLASLASFIPSDDSDPDPRGAGRVLARLHGLPPPEGLNMVVQYGKSVLDLFPARLTARWASLLSFVPDLPSLPSEAELASYLCKLGRFPDSLLHMDFRAANLRTEQGKIVGVLDWENTLVGPAAVDLMRVREIGGFDDHELTAGYEEVAGSLPQLDEEEELVLRLDPAVMLALVFFSEAPDAENAAVSVARVRELVAKLNPSTS